MVLVGWVAGGSTEGVLQGVDSIRERLVALG